MIAPQHVVSIVIGGSEIRGAVEYQIDVGMLDPSDAFSVTYPASREIWDLVQPDRPVRILIDGSVPTWFAVVVLVAAGCVPSGQQLLQHLHGTADP